MLNLSSRCARRAGRAGSLLHAVGPQGHSSIAALARPPGPALSTDTFPRLLCGHTGLSLKRPACAHVGLCWGCRDRPATRPAWLQLRSRAEPRPAPAPAAAWDPHPPRGVLGGAGTGLGGVGGVRGRVSGVCAGRCPGLRVRILPPRARATGAQWGPRTPGLAEATTCASPAARLPAPGLAPAALAPPGPGAGLWEGGGGPAPSRAGRSAVGRPAGSAQGCVRRPRASVAGRGLGATRGAPRPPRGTAQVRQDRGARCGVGALFPDGRHRTPRRPGLIYRLGDAAQLAGAGGGRTA